MTQEQGGHVVQHESFVDFQWMIADLSFGGLE
jgi:hypothetical protein